jgi:hypothetical protein
LLAGECLSGETRSSKVYRLVVRAHSARGLTSLDSTALVDRDLPLVRSAGSGLPASVSVPRVGIGYGSGSTKVSPTI